MKDLEIGRLINVAIAGAAVVGLAACGGGDAEEESSGGVFRESCEITQECVPEEFELDFDSLAECEDYYITYNEYLDDEYGPDCARADREFTECFANAIESACGEEDALDLARDACPDEEEAYEAACQ